MNTDGINSINDITLSGDSDAYFNNLTVGTFKDVSGSYFTGITSNIQTQINGISGSLGSTYVTIATAQDITGQKTFTTGILPRRTGGDGTDVQIGGTNQMQYRQATSQYNIGIGANTVVGDTDPSGNVNNTGKRNVAIGDSALQTMDNGVDNIAIGYESMKNCGSQRIYSATTSRAIAIGTGAIKYGIYGDNNTVIGHYAMQNNNSGGGNIVIGNYNAAGLAQNYCVIIGSGSAPSLNDDGVISIGSQCLGAATGSANGVTAIGVQAGYNNTNGQRGTFFGQQAGYSNTSGYYNNCFGYCAGYGSNATANFCTAIGAFANYLEDNEFVLGGDNFASSGERFPRLTLPNKTRLACCQFPTGATISLSFRTNENIILTDAITATINLPTPTSTDFRNIGCKFYINRQVAGVDITIYPPSGQTLSLNQLDGTIITMSSYTWVKGSNSITLLCIAATGTTWQLLPPAVAQGADTLYVSTTNPVPTFNLSIPFAGTTLSGYQPHFMDNANLNYKQSTTTLTATNIASSGTITGNNINLTNRTNIQATQSFGAVANAVLTFNTNENVLITTTTTTSIQLPTPSAGNIGCTFNIYKTYTGSSIITVIAPSGQQILGDGSAATSYNFGYNQTYLIVTCIATTGTTWTARGNGLHLARNDASTISATYTFSANPVFNTGAIPTSAIAGFTTSGFVDTTTNQTIAGTKTFTSDIIVGSTSTATANGSLKVNLNYLPYGSTNLLSTATVLPDLPTLYGIYYFSSGPSATIITLPSISSYTMNGCILHFKRAINNVSELIIKTSTASGNTIIPRNSGTEIPSNTNYTLLSTTQYYATLVAFTSGLKWAVLI